MKRILLYVWFGLCFLGGAKAQRVSGLIDKSNVSDSYLTISLGPDYCYADTKASPLSQSILQNYDFSLGFRKRFASNLGYKASFDYSNFTGTDDSSIKRQYSFTSNVMQVALLGEYHINMGGKSYNRTTPNSIYGFLGAGWLISNAKLKTDSIERGHYLTKSIYGAPVIPFGAGYQYNFNNGFLLGAEFNFRFPFSDFIDGFNPINIDYITGIKSGSKSNDFLAGFSITFSYIIDSEYLKRH